MQLTIFLKIKAFEGKTIVNSVDYQQARFMLNNMHINIPAHHTGETRG